MKIVVIDMEKVIDRSYNYKDEREKKDGMFGKNFNGKKHIGNYVPNKN